MYEEELNEVKQKCLSCKKCPLSETRTTVVFSGGIPNSKLMLIGEAPGYWEDQKGEPFVGKAGQLLDKIFASVGLSRQKDVYICNTIKCRPPENRNPLPEEKDACREFLDAQIRILHPKIILLAGSVAVQSILGDIGGITRIRGKWFDGEAYGLPDTKIMPIFHPSYLLRNDSREKGSPKWLMWQDIQEIRKAYDNL
ncbi:uracil-DNA glycosylase [bacterium]|nr:uracil-DNA glycosylase [bacterium]